MTQLRYVSAILISIFLFSATAGAQGVSFNTTGLPADGSAMLDVASTTKGLLAPRMTAAQVAAISAPATGLLVYQTDGTAGFYYYSGAAWTALSGGGSGGWSLTGNAGTLPGTNFIGTTDSEALQFRVNNTWAGQISTGSTGNTAYGINTLQSATGNNNTATGYNSLAANTTGTDNTATGYNSLAANTAAGSTAYGSQSLAANTTGAGNTATGCQSLYSNITGGQNTANGFQCLISNTAGAANTAMGYESLKSNTTGSANTANGYESLISNTTGGANTANGYESLSSNTTGIGNTATGVQSLNSNTTGNVNTANGYVSLNSNTTGTNNTAIGSSSLNQNTTGSFNTANGSGSLQTNTTGSNNTANGYQSLLFNTAGSNNTATGYQSLFSNTTNDNTAYGYQSLYSNATGSNNTAYGYLSLHSNTTGFDNTALGNNANVGSGALTNAMALGNGATVSSSNTVVVGNSSVTSIGGQVGWTTISDGRFKSKVQENVPGLAFIMALRPVTYNLDARKLERFKGVHDSLIQENAGGYDKAESIVRTGFIAQDVEKAAQRAGFDFDGIHKPQNEKDNYGLSYSAFTVPLVKAVQEQQQTITALQKEVAELLQRIQAMEDKK